jgi:hypothetical protein
MVGMVWVVNLVARKADEVSRMRDNEMRFGVRRNHTLFSLRRPGI